MAILVTGSTGTVGSRVVEKLIKAGATVRALTRSPEQARFPQGVTPVAGELLDVEAMRVALGDVSTLFLLAPVTADELNQTLITLALARDAGLTRIVYLSVLNADLFTDVPHFTAKHTAERMIEQLDLPVTILRPCYFMQNDLGLKDAIMGAGLYPMPVGGVGVSMVDVDDIAEVAAGALLARERAAEPLPREMIEIGGSEPLTGEKLATIWSAVLGRPVRYAGDDVVAFEQQVAQHAPGWLAYDMRLMVARFQQDGATVAPSAVERLTSRLGRPPRAYRDFAEATARQWQSA